MEWFQDPLSYGIFSVQFLLLFLAHEPLFVLNIKLFFSPFLTDFNNFWWILFSFFRSQQTRFQCLVPDVSDALTDVDDDDVGWCWWLGGGVCFSLTIGAKDKRSPSFTVQWIRWNCKTSIPVTRFWCEALNQRGNFVSSSFVVNVVVLCFFLTSLTYISIVCIQIKKYKSRAHSVQLLKQNVKHICIVFFYFLFLCNNFARCW